MKTKNSFIWERNFSAIGAIEIPAGAPVQWHERNKCFYVDPDFFEKDSILRHDAIHYGCQVSKDNITE